jgi:hypothetical protein
MLNLLRRGFPHRHNAKVDSQFNLPMCLATVATIQDGRELDRLESGRVCEPVKLYRVSQVGLRGERACVLAISEGAIRRERENGTLAL